MVRSKQKHIIEDENGNYEITVKSNRRNSKCKNSIIKYLSKSNNGREKKKKDN